MSSSGSYNDITIPLIAGTLLLAVLMVFILYFIFLHHRTRQKFDWERQQFKQAVLQTEIEIREQTLTHMSRELHDNLGHIASLIKINLNLVSKNIAETDRSKIDESIDLLKQLIGDIKSLSVSLNSERLANIGLLEAITNDVLRINKTGHMKMQLEVNCEMPQLGQETEIFLYRISQEILNNSIKHSRATVCIITLYCTEQKLILKFSDNGTGFDVEKTLAQNNANKGSGLSNLSKRSKIIGAELNMTSSINSGTSILITLPLQKEKV
jgi:two-component system NarL family sensor kinase